MPGAQPYPQYGMYPIPPRVKKPIRFPLTRGTSALLQISGMLLYSLVFALIFMGCALTLLKASVSNPNVYTNPDGSVNLLTILATCIIGLLLVPASSVFCGTFLGSWRGLMVSVISLVGGALITHLTDASFGNLNITIQSYLPFAALPISALAVGLVYDRRRYAAWWKSLLTMFLGAAVLLSWFFAFIYFANATTDNIDILAANAHMTTQGYLAYMAISLSVVALLLIPLLGLFFAAIEGLIHLIIVKSTKR